jgi:DNA-binding SARP family transcriptional activator
LEIRLLGPFEIRVDGVPQRLGRRQHRLLLALLALQAGDVVTTTRIADLLWDGEPPRTSANAIQVHVAALRRLLSPAAIETCPEGYRLPVPPTSLDYRQFEEGERCAAAALKADLLPEARQALADALALWRGPALDGLSGRYAEAQSARLEERRLAALERRIDIDLTMGRYTDLVGELKGLLAEHPLHQGLTRRLMLALYGAGRPAEALTVYRQGRRLLVDELGIEPDDTLRLTHEAVLRGEQPGILTAALLPASSASPDGAGARDAVARPVPRQLPADMAHFTGRTADLAVLDRGLCVDGGPAAMVISTVTGTAGVGKTALAIRWAHQVRDRFPDGDLYVDLHGYAAGRSVTPSEALDGFLRALGVPPNRIPQAEDSRTGLYRSLLNGRRMLVVLDNAGSAAQVRPLLPGTPDCLVIVTSRSTLAGLTVRNDARPVTLHAMPPAEALTLLGKVIGAARVGAEPAAAASVARWCAHLPLALRIAAERMSHSPDVTLADLAGELADEHNRLDLLATDDEATTVRAVFSWSYRTLPPEAARAFRLLGLHAGPDLSAGAAAALTGTRTAEALRLLEALAGVHLLERTGRDRYRLHDLLCLYAAERASDEPPAERAQAVDRVLTWYLHAAHAADRALGPPQRHYLPLGPPPVSCPAISFTGPEQARAWFEAERANLVAAVHQAARADPPHAAAWKLPNVLWWFFYLRKDSDDWIATSRCGLVAAQHMRDRDGESRTWNVLGNAYGDLQRFDDALDCYRRAAEIRAGLDDLGCGGIILHNLGITCLELERFDEALGHLHRALEVRRTIGDRYGEGCTLSALGDAHSRLHQFTAATLCLHRALRIRSDQGNKYGQASTLHNLGDTYLAAGRYDRAFAYLNRALELCGELDNPHGTATVLFSLGKGQCLVGQRAKARRSLAEAFTIFSDLEAPQAADVRAHLEKLDVGTEPSVSVPTTNRNGAA